MKHEQTHKERTRPAIPTRKINASSRGCNQQERKHWEQMPNTHAVSVDDRAQPQKQQRRNQKKEEFRPRPLPIATTPSPPRTSMARNDNVNLIVVVRGK